MNLKAGMIMLLVITMGSIISACKDQNIPLSAIYSSTNCPIDKQLLKRINSQSELKQLLESKPGNFTPNPATNIEIDYDKQTLIVFALGQKPTTGYSLQLYKNEAVIRGQKLFLPIRVLEPDKNKLQAQVITSPCQIFSLPHADYTEILVDNYSAD